MLEKFIQFFKERNLSLTREYLIAVSGGIDSSVLCELCKQAGLKFSIAHCNFQLREEESERDEKFVKNIGEKYGVTVVVKKFNTKVHADEKKISIQEAARDLRYAWFIELKTEFHFEGILLAHQADDNIETILMNFFRGTGLKGLLGMPPIAVKYCYRPMLEFRRKEIEEFALRNNLQWVEDSSNSSSKYTRNFFRNELIPQIKKVFPAVEENLLQNIERFNAIHSLYDVSVSFFKRTICKKINDEVSIPVEKLKPYCKTALIYEIIKEYGFSEKQVEEVVKLLDAESGKFIENANCQIIKHRNWLIIAPRKIYGDTIAITEQLNTVQFGAGRLEFKKITKEKFRLQKEEQIAQIDAKKIEYPLLLRKWKQGDYFYPLGMRKKKKLARFFIDEKLSKNKKENVWVLESNKKIIWVAGMRIDDRFKITDKTKEILVVTLSSL